MHEELFWETYTSTSDRVAARIAECLQTRSLRRIVIDCHGKTIAEFPIAPALADIVGPPISAAVAGLSERLRECLVHLQVIERTSQPVDRQEFTGRL